jgi:ankyrin repeat protein
MMFTQRQYGLYVNHKDIFDCTPLHFAVINGQFKCAECLLALGANPNAVNVDGHTPLHVAV